MSGNPWASAGYGHKRGPGDAAFRDSATLTLKLYKPPYVFCTTSDVVPAKLISVQVHNHLHFPLLLTDLQLYLSCVQANAAETSETFLQISAMNGQMPQTLDAESRHAFIFAIEPDDISTQFAADAAGAAPDHGPGSAAAKAKAVAAGGGGKGGASKDKDKDTERGARGDVLDPGQRADAPEDDDQAAVDAGSKARAVRSPTVGPALPAVDVIVSTTWTVQGLVTPVACQYQLVRMMPRIALFTMSASHAGPVRVGTSFHATYNITNMSANTYDLTLLVGNPRLKNHTPTAINTYGQPASAVASDARAARAGTQPSREEERVAKQRAMQAKAVSAMADLDSGARLHIQALAELDAQMPGLICEQKALYLGECGPTSSLRATATFHAYQAGVYEIGNVKLCDSNGGQDDADSIKHKVLRYYIEVSD